MALKGQAVVCSFSDVLAEHRENFHQWHNREHMPERLALPGFLRGRRFAAVCGTPEFFILYELKDLAVAHSAAYLERLNNPTEWTKRSSRNFRNSFRAVSRVLFTAGVGAGGFLLAMRCDLAAGSQAPAALAEQLLPSLVLLVGVTGVHLAVHDPEISNIRTVERAGRGAAFDQIPMIVLVEAVSAGVAAHVRETCLSEDRLSALGMREPRASGIYAMEICCEPAGSGTRGG